MTRIIHISNYAGKSIFLLLSAVLLFSWNACKEEEPIIPVTPPDEPMAEAYCTNISTSLTQLIVQEGAGNLLIDIDNQDTLVNFIYDNGESLIICSDSLLQFSIDSAANEINILMTDSSSYNGFFFAEEIDLSIESILNPTGYAPLSAELNILADIEGSVHMHLIGQDGPYSDVIKSFENISEEHQIPVLGLYIDYQNQIILDYYSRNNLLLFSDTIIIETAPFDIDLPDVFIDVNEVEDMAPGFQLISHLDISPSLPFMIDPYGKTRFLYDWRDHPQLEQLSFDVGMERLNNGNYYFGDKGSDLIYEVDVMGNVLNTWPLSDYNYHHNVFEKGDGNLLCTAEEDDSEHIDFGITNEDRILEIDRGTGALLKVWDVRYLLDETRNTFVDFQGDWLKDWAHLNAVVHDESDNTIIFSSRHQSTICKVNYSDEIQWIISPRIDFGMNRQGQNLEPYYLTAVDNNGVPYPDGVQDGSDNIEEFEWPWFQHAVKVIGLNRIICFDNGNQRNYGNSPSNYSRAVIYNIDPVNMTISQEWAYGRDRGNETFSFCCSDADFLEEENHIIFSPGLNTNNWNGSGGRVVEIDYDTQEVIFEARINSDGITHHRTERLMIYPE